VGRVRDSHHLLGLSKMRSRQSPTHGMSVFDFSQLTSERLDFTIALTGTNLTLQGMWSSTLL
jgi:hypothetical protein